MKSNYLVPTYFFDFEDPQFQEYLKPFKDSQRSKLDLAVSAYLFVRENWRYDPYVISFNAADLRASSILQKKTAHCIDKSILLVSFFRALNIPARLQLAKVSNHIAVEKLTKRFGTNIMTPHGLVNVFLGDKWIKLSPAFNKGLCEMYDVAPLDFDGKRDSVFQEYNSKGQKFMKYLEDYGHFEDVPVDFIHKNMLEHYPEMKEAIDGNGIMNL